MSTSNPYRHLYDLAYMEKLHQLNSIGNNRYRETQRLATIEQLGPFSTSDDVLELGCGTGRYTRLLARRVGSIIGLDFSVAAINKAVSQEKPDNVNYVVGDMQQLGMFKDATFNKIFAIDVLEHLSDPQLKISLCEISRLLKPNGVFVFFTPCRSHWIERLKDRNFILKQFEEHVGVRTEGEYRQFIQDLGLNVKEVARYETCIPGLRVGERILKKAPVIGNLFVSRLGVSVTA